MASPALAKKADLQALRARSLHIGRVDIWNFIENFKLLWTNHLWSELKTLADGENAHARRINQMQANGPAAPAADRFVEMQAAITQLNDRLTKTGAALDEANAARAKGEVAIASLTAQVAALAERHQTAVTRHLDVLTEHFAAPFAEAAALVETMAASARDAKAAAAETEAHLEELRGEFAAARDAIPRLAEQAVREIVEAIEQEPGVLALALGNAQTFTSTIAKTVER